MKWDTVQDRWKLRSELEIIHETCTKASRIVYHGFFSKSPAVKILWSDNLTSDKSYTNYLNGFINSKSNILVISTEVNKIEIDQTLQEFLSIEEDEDEIFTEERIKMYTNALESKGHVVFYRLVFFDGICCYEFQRHVDWYRDYNDMKDIYSNEPLVVEKSNNEFIQISEIRKEEIARKIISEESYKNSKTKFERREIANKVSLVEGVDFYYNQKLVSDRAEMIFHNEIKPIQDAELKLKIKELRDKKYSKVKIMGELGITKTVLDKFYY